MNTAATQISVPFSYPLLVANKLWIHHHLQSCAKCYNIILYCFTVCT